MKKTRKMSGLGRRLISAALCSVLCFTAVDALAEAPAGKWYTDFGSYEAEKKSAGELTERIMEEGAVLLKNDGILPLAKWMFPLAERSLHLGEKQDVAYFEPFYFKEYVAGTPKEKVKRGK